MRTYTTRGRAMDDMDLDNELLRLYRIVCTAGLKEAAEILKDMHPNLRSYDNERRLIEARNMDARA